MKKRGTQTETFIIGDEVNITDFCKSCGENIEDNRGKEYNFVCINCESVVMFRDDEHAVDNFLDTNLS